VIRGDRAEMGYIRGMGDPAERRAADENFLAARNSLPDGR